MVNKPINEFPSSGMSVSKIPESRFPKTRIFRELHFDLDDLNLMSILNKMKVPVLFIHGKNDGLVDYMDTQRGFEKILAPKEFLLAEESDHLGALYELGDEYWKCIDSFIAMIESTGE